MDTMKDTKMQPATDAVIEELRKVIADCYWPTSPVAINEILDRLEAAEKDIALKEKVIDALGSGLNAVAKERDELRAKIAEMEKQEPVRWFYVTYGEWDCYNREKPQEGAYDAGSLMALYALPGAQPAPSVPDGWLRAIDEALVTAHIGVANAHDTYEQAKAKLDNLIGFHVDVATDPAVNGGFKLMPVEPTKEIYECFSAYDGTSYSNPFDFDDFRVDYGFALAAAPEAKP